LQLGGVVSYPKNGNIFGLGPLLRWNFLQNGRCRLFADAGADILQTGDTAYIIPLGGTGYNFFLRAGSGASFSTAFGVLAGRELPLRSHHNRFRPRRRQLHSMERLGGLVGAAAHVSLICLYNDNEKSRWMSDCSRLKRLG